MYWAIISLRLINICEQGPSHGNGHTKQNPPTRDVKSAAWKCQPLHACNRAGCGNVRLSCNAGRLFHEHYYHADNPNCNKEAPSFFLLGNEQDTHSDIKDVVAAIIGSIMADTRLFDAHYFSIVSRSCGFNHRKMTSANTRTPGVAPIRRSIRGFCPFSSRYSKITCLILDWAVSGYIGN